MPKTRASKKNTFSKFGKALREKYMTRPPQTQGVIVDASTDEYGRAVSYVVRGKGTREFRNVRASNLPGEGIGSVVRMEGDGLTGTLWRVAKVLYPYRGAGSTDNNGFYSTPTIKSIATEVVQDDAGNDVVKAYFVIGLVPENYNGGLKTLYEIQVRDEEASDLPIVWSKQSPPLERIAGRLKTALDASQTDEIEATRYDEEIPSPVSYLFVQSKGVVRIGSEEIMYDRVGGIVGNDITLEGLNRGYAGTTGATHAVDADVVLYGVTVPGSWVLLSNRIYGVQVRAVCAVDGRHSNWSDWETFTTEYDTTPPDWIAAPITPTVTAVRNGLEISWIPADENYSDLAYYEVQEGSITGTYTTIYRAGNGTGFSYPCNPGTVRLFRVRAVDRTGNQSSWSNGVRGEMVIFDEPDTASIVLNPTAQTNTTNWTVGGLGGSPALSRTTSVFFSSPAAFELSQTRDSTLFRTLTAQSATITTGLTGGTRWYARIYIQSPDRKATDEFAFGVNWRNASGLLIEQSTSRVFFGSELNTDPSNWFLINFNCVMPIAASQAEVVLAASVAPYTSPGQVLTLRYDDVRLMMLNDGDSLVMTKVDRDADFIKATATWDPASMLDGSVVSTTITATGATVGMPVHATHDQLGSNLVLVSAHVQATNTVRVVILNKTGSALDIASGTLTAIVDTR